ncbi:MAG: TetR/AcrR family transcriptional regulator [Pseudomonadota bacterium]
MALTTREQLLATAEQLFAEKGFYGASIATIAKELGLTKQALLHHFGNKEKLYGEVLSALSARLAAGINNIRQQRLPPGEQLEEMLLAQYREQMTNQNAARLIMRELLDNEARADQAGNWYLKDYLEELVETARAASPGAKPSRAAALALVYQLLGAAHYFAISQPTLVNIFGKATLNRTRQQFEAQLRAIVQASLSTLAS